MKEFLIYAESRFFSKLYEQDDIKVKMLMNEGRLLFVGGGWSINDEGVAHYQSIVDQFSWGLRFLNDTFGECAKPMIGWQIDPFGHSNTQAALFAKMGYDRIFFFTKSKYRFSVIFGSFCLISIFCSKIGSYDQNRDST